MNGRIVVLHLIFLTIIWIPEKSVVEQLPWF